MEIEADRSQADALASIGNRLRGLRQKRGLSMREAGMRAGMSASFIGLVERGESEIAITRLMRLVDVYGVTVADILGDKGEMRAGQRVGLDYARRITADDGRVEILYLSIPMPSVEPFRLVLAPDAHIEGIQHATREFFHCVAGSPTMLFAGEDIVLEPGDSIVVPPDLPHGWHNSLAETSVLVGAVERSSEPSPLW